MIILWPVAAGAGRQGGQSQTPISQYASVNAPGPGGSVLVLTGQGTPGIHSQTLPLLFPVKPDLFLHSPQKSSEKRANESDSVCSTLCLVLNLTLSLLSTTTVATKLFLISWSNHCYWVRNVCLNIKICKCMVSDMSNFHLLGVVGCGSETQLQMGKNFSKITWSKKRVNFKSDVVI